MYPVRPLRFLRTFHRKLSEAKQAEKTAKRRGLKVLPFVKPSGRAVVTVAILLLSSHMNRAENRTLLQVPFCREWGCGRGDFGGKLAQLGVPCADVRTGGEIVWAKRVAHRLSLYLVRARNFLVALIPRSGTSPTSSLPAEYVLKNLSVFVRSVNEGSEQNSGNPCTKMNTYLANSIFYDRIESLNI